MTLCTLKGAIGTAMAITLPSIQSLDGWIRIVGGLCGLLLVGVSIYEKYLRIKEMKKKE